jgi:DNA helicase HerA-like ATPase
VFFFDEAHLLFDDAPPALRQRVEQVVRLIRSKGVGVYFISQLPDDVPDEILGQLGNRVQHALRAFTPRDQKAVKTAAETFPANPKFKVTEAITQLGVGEALVTTLQEGGVPLPVERTYMAPPQCRIGAISDEERAQVRQRSPVGGKYDSAVNRESAYEMLETRKAAPPPAPVPAPAPAGRAPEPEAARKDDGGGMSGMMKDWLFGTRRRQGVIETVAKTAMRTATNKATNQIMRGILGSILRGR